MSLQLERRGAVLTVTLNRPEVRNAFDEAAIDAIMNCFHGLAKDQTLRAVIIRGEGKDFCAGADVGMMRRAADYAPARNKKEALRLIGMCRAIDDCPAPIIARVHGACFGGGFGIVAASDIVVAADDAVLSFSECRLGIVPAVISNFVLSKMGASAARRYFLTAETFDARAARDMGLVHVVAPEVELDARIAELLKWLLRGGPNAVREAKLLLRKVQGLTRDQRVRLTVATLARVRASAEAKEGMSAFLEKRAPSWVADASASISSSLKT